MSLTFTDYWYTPDYKSEMMEDWHTFQVKGRFDSQRSAKHRKTVPLFYHLIDLDWFKHRNLYSQLVMNVTLMRNLIMRSWTHQRQISISTSSKQFILLDLFKNFGGFQWPWLLQIELNWFFLFSSWQRELLSALNTIIELNFYLWENDFCCRTIYNA